MGFYLYKYNAKTVFFIMKNFTKKKIHKIILKYWYFHSSRLQFVVFNIKRADIRQGAVSTLRLA